MFRSRCLPLPILLLMCAVWMLACGVSFAVDTIPAHVPGAVASPAPSALAAFLTNSLFPILTALALGLLRPFLKRLGEKYHIESLTQENSLLEQMAFQGITYAEEKAAQLAGSRAQLTGSQKMDLAISHILTAMPAIPRDEAERVVHALLAQIPGAGATGDTALSRDAWTAGIAPIQGAELQPVEAAAV